MLETSGTKWVQCAQCAEWFHQERCVKVPSVAVRKKNVPIGSVLDANCPRYIAI